MTDLGPIFAALRRSVRDHRNTAEEMLATASETQIAAREAFVMVAEGRMDISELKEQFHHWQQAANENATRQHKATRNESITNIILGVVGVAVVAAIAVDVAEHRAAFKETREQITAIKEGVRGCVVPGVQLPGMKP